MIKTLITIRDVLMYAGGLIGIFLIGYIRVSFSSRQLKSSEPLQYNERELKLRKIAIVILVITIILVLIPTRYFQ